MLTSKVVASGAATRAGPPLRLSATARSATAVGTGVRVAKTARSAGSTAPPVVRPSRCRPCSLGRQDGPKAEWPLVEATEICVSDAIRDYSLGNRLDFKLEISGSKRHSKKSKEFMTEKAVTRDPVVSESDPSFPSERLARFVWVGHRRN